MDLKKMTGPRLVHGDDLLYRFFQDLFLEDTELARTMPTRMLSTMAIWFPLDVYHDFPVLLPWVVRDPTCRGSRSKGVADQWGSPNEAGFLRDDNSLIKSLPRSLAVATADPSHLRGARMGSEFVASHIWRVVSHRDLASRVPLLNSFVPNLVWLPSQVAKLSDREGSAVQIALQAMAWQIYRSAPVAAHLADVVEEAWALIPEPDAIGPLPNLNWFEATDRFFKTRRARLSSVVDGLERLNTGKLLDTKIVTTRYTEGLPTVDPESRVQLGQFLKRFIAEP